MGRRSATNRNDLAAWLLIAATLTAIVVITPGAVAPPYVVEGWKQLSVEVVRVVSGPVILVSGVVLWRWRRTNRLGPAVIALGLSFQLFVGTAQVQGEDQLLALAAAASTLRPILFFIVLAVPTGRLRRHDVWVIALPIVSGVCFVASVLIDPTGGDAVGLDPDSTWIAAAIAQFAETVLLPLSAIVLALLCWTRHRALGATARQLDVLVLAAGLIATVPDLVLVVSSDYFVDPDDGHWPVWWWFVRFVDSARFAAVALLLVLSAARARRILPAGRADLSIDIGTSSFEPLEAQLAAALGTADVDIGYRSGDGWVSGAGVPLGDPRPERCVTIVESDGEPIVRVDLDGAFNERPTSVEVAVAAATGTIRHQRMSALALQRLGAATRARADVLEVEDSVRTRLQRDLHDGAQQQLVGLALQARLATRGGRAADVDVVDQLRRGISIASGDLRRLADGLAPSIVAELGLGAALSTLAATTPLDVDVHIALPRTVGTDGANVAWFVVCEAVANAVRHADATSLSISASVDDRLLRVAVSDDGNGGADRAAGTGLRLLDRRVRAAGGTLTIDARPGLGSTVRAELPTGEGS